MANKKPARISKKLHEHTLDDEVMMGPFIDHLKHGLEPGDFLNSVEDDELFDEMMMNENLFHIFLKMSSGEDMTTGESVMIVKAVIGFCLRCQFNRHHKTSYSHRKFKTHPDFKDATLALFSLYGSTRINGETVELSEEDEEKKDSSTTTNSTGTEDNFNLSATTE